MSNEWKDCSSLQELAAAQARGDDIMEWRESSGHTWNGTVWGQWNQYRCRPAKPATKTVTLRKALLRDSDGRYYTSEGSCSYKNDRFFVCWLGDPYIVEVPK